MRTRATILALVAIAAGCKKGQGTPEWHVTSVGNLHEAGALELFDHESGDRTVCGLVGVWEPTDQDLDLMRAYRQALDAVVKDHVVAFTVITAAEVVHQTATTRMTSGVDQCDVTIANKSVGPMLVASGWGRAAPSAPKAIVDAETVARTAHVGMWSPQGRNLLRSEFAKQHGVTTAELPLTGELSWALHEVSSWQPRLAYVDLDIEDIIVVNDAQGQRLPHWKTLPDPNPRADAGVAGGM